jgi:hypothetical protein
MPVCSHRRISSRSACSAAERRTLRVPRAGVDGLFLLLSTINEDIMPGYFVRRGCSNCGRAAAADRAGPHPDGAVPSRCRLFIRRCNCPALALCRHSGRAGSIRAAARVSRCSSPRLPLPIWSALSFGLHGHWPVGREGLGTVGVDSLNKIVPVGRIAQALSAGKPSFLAPFTTPSSRPGMARSDCRRRLAVTACRGASTEWNPTAILVAVSCW